MTFEAFFESFKKRFEGADVSKIKDHLAYQFNITGDNTGGAFYVEVKEGELYVEPYEYHDRNALFTCAPETLISIADGKLDPMIAYTKGDLKVEGDLGKALQLKEIIKTAQKAKKAVEKKTAVKKTIAKKKA